MRKPKTSRVKSPKRRRRVRYARHKLLSDALADPHYDNSREKMAGLRSLLRKNAPDLPVETSLNSTPQGPDKLATILSQELNNYWRWAAMSSERYPGASLPLEPSMRHAELNDCNEYNLPLIVVRLAERSQNSQSFPMQGGPPKSGTARMTLRFVAGFCEVHAVARAGGGDLSPMRSIR
jgi:hypothetical protein